MTILNLLDLALQHETTADFSAWFETLTESEQQALRAVSAKLTSMLLVASFAQVGRAVNQVINNFNANPVQKK